MTDNSGSVSTGGTLVFTATVGGPGGIPTGSVVWTGSACSTFTTVLSPLGVATCSITDARPAAYGVTATYDGDTNYNGSFGTESRRRGPGHADPPDDHQPAVERDLRRSFPATVT